MNQWLYAIHHDGSAPYVSNSLPTLNETVELRLRVPKDAPIRAVYLRTWRDGEQRDKPMELAQGEGTAHWYTTTFKLRNQANPYCFKIGTEDGYWYYYNGNGISGIEDINAFNFNLLTDFAAPLWVRDTVFYQIFPDRFYNGDPNLNPPADTVVNSSDGGVYKTQMRDWDSDDPLPWHEGGSLDFFGGDLPGITAKIDYLQDLGVTALYLNPIFSSITNHKYNIEDFFEVDQYFGGNDALVALRQALSDANMRLMLDVTSNHCGSNHIWFKRAQANANAPENAYFTFYDHPYDYEMWLGIATLPKLNYRSTALRDVMIRAEDSAIKYWLKPPFSIDGWRLDVWNMTARQREIDLNHEVGREIRHAVKSTNPDAYLIGESFFDATPNLQGDQLDAIQNYRGFSNPVWRWLAGHDTSPTSDGIAPVPIDAADAAAQMQQYVAAVPWVIARQQFNQLGSHDVSRILLMVEENEALAKVAAVILLTFLGVPCIYYGDEIGMSGKDHGDKHRRPMRWDRDLWNHDMRNHYKSLIHLRRQSDALINGGLQFVFAEGPILAYQRQSEAERVVVIAYRDHNETPLDVSIPLNRTDIMDGARFEDVLSGQQYTVSSGAIMLTGLTDPIAFVLRAV